MTLPPPDPKVYRSTAGLCLGLRGGLASALVVLSCKRTDPARTLYVVHEFEQTALNIDEIAEALRYARKNYHTVATIGYHGGRDDEAVFKVLSIRLGQHIQPAPGDAVAPMQLLIDDIRSGRLKAHADSLVARDSQAAVWRDGVPDHTGVLSALRCAHWAMQQYRVLPSKAKTGQAKTGQMARERARRMERPF